MTPANPSTPEVTRADAWLDEWLSQDGTGYRHSGDEMRAAIRHRLAHSPARGGDELREALEQAADEFDLILARLRDHQPERAEGAAICGAKDARKVLDSADKASEGESLVLMPKTATRAMVDAADACTDAYSAYAAMVEAAHVH